MLPAGCRRRRCRHAACRRAACRHQAAHQPTALPTLLRLCRYAQDGFIHLTADPQLLLTVANHFYTASQGDWLVLVLDSSKLAAEVRMPARCASYSCSRRDGGYIVRACMQHLRVYPYSAQLS
jgi:hypothetical protein